MELKETRAEYFNILPTYFRPKAYIVGGAATDLEKAGDVDIVILDKCEDFIAITELIEAYNHDEEGMKFDYKVEISAENYNSAIRGELCKIKVPELSRTIHLLLSNVDTIEEVLNDFDISTHQFAFNCYDMQYAAKTATPPQAPAKVLKFNTPESTLLRYSKVCNRYGLPIDKAIIDQLEGLL